MEEKPMYSLDLRKYYFQEYYYNVLSKIIPYYQMLICLLQETNDDSYNLHLDLLSDWQGLAKYMHLKIYKDDHEYEGLIKKGPKYSIQKNKL